MCVLKIIFFSSTRISNLQWFFSLKFIYSTKPNYKQKSTPQTMLAV